jgi:hypothetical protein
MPRYAAAALAMLLVVCSGCAMGGGRTDLYYETISPGFGGDLAAYMGGPATSFSDPDAVICKGPITSIEVFCDDYIRGIRLTYGQGGVGDLHGIRYGQDKEWKVPNGEKIVRVEGEYTAGYVSRLQFFTDAGERSPVFGGKQGTPFAVSDPSGGSLRTISGWVNTQRSRAYQRAVMRVTLHYCAPYYIKDIRCDTDALAQAKLNAAPYEVAHVELPNRTSLEQQVVYEQKKTVKTEKTVTFEEALGLSFGGSLSAEVSAGLGKFLGASARSEFHWDASSTTTFGHSYTNSESQEVSWSIPVKVPAHSKVVAVSTMRRYKATVPFTYTIAWYVGSKDNVKKEITLPGFYEGTQVEDLQHEFNEVPLN